MDQDPGDQRRASLRASDADRERFVEALSQHHGRPGRAGHRPASAPAAGLGARLGSLRGRRAPPDAPSRPRRAAAKTNLLRSVLWYGVLSLVLIVVWLASGRDYFWPVWPILGFALLLGWQAIAVWSRVSPYDDRPRRRDDNP
jgi:hypothetical protein